MESIAIDSRKSSGAWPSCSKVTDKMNVMVRELSLAAMKMESSPLSSISRGFYFDERQSVRRRESKTGPRILRIYNKEHRNCDAAGVIKCKTSRRLTRRVCHDHGKIFFDGPLEQIVDRFSVYKIVSLTFDANTVVISRGLAKS